MEYMSNDVYTLYNALSCGSHYIYREESVLCPTSTPILEVCPNVIEDKIDQIDIVSEDVACVISKQSSCRRSSKR